MKETFTDILDTALDELSDNEPVEGIITRFPDQAQELIPLLQAAKALDSVRDVELPAAEVLQSDRDEFMAAVVQLENIPVSPGPLERIKGWVRKLVPQKNMKVPSHPKEKRTMTALLFRMTIALSVLLTSMGGTVALAENSLPDTPLYGMKMAMEQVQLNLSTDPEQTAAKHLVFARNRIQEIKRLAQADEVSGEGTRLRLEEHLNTALQLATQLGDEEMLGILNEAHLMIQEQTRELTQTQARLTAPVQEPVQQTVRILNRVREQVEAGLSDPEAFRQGYRHGALPEGESPGPGEPGGNPECPSEDCDPVGDQNQYGPQPEQPGPGEPGGNQDCLSGGCEPIGDQNQYGPKADQPGPGEPGGNQECTSEDCEPQGGQQQRQQQGPQSEDPGPGEPGGNQECPSGECEPQGGQQQQQQGPQSEDPGPGGPGGNQESPSDGGNTSSIENGQEGKTTGSTKP